MVIVAYGAEFNEFVVKDVAENSPAEEAGLLPGDVIVRLQGVPAHLFTLDGINILLQRKVGKVIRVSVLRDHKEVTKKFILRDLI